MKRTCKITGISCLLAATIVCLGSKITFAGNPVQVIASGQAAVWPNGGRNIPFNPDQGGLGSLSNAEAVSLTAAAFGQWEGVPTATATYVNAGQLPFDVNETNFVSIFIGSFVGVNPIVFDQNGAIFNLIFGDSSGILGFTGVYADPQTGQILRGYVFINGGDEFPGIPVTQSVLLETEVHEFGHYSGLGHSFVNGEIFLVGDTTGPTPYQTFPAPNMSDQVIETMYPLLFFDLNTGQSNAGQETPELDDRSMLSTLYPEPGFFANSGTISGHIRLKGTKPLNGVNVIARNIANPYKDAVSAVSGNLAISGDQNDPFAGVYTLNGLTPGANYAVYVDDILIDSAIPGATTSLPGPEEFYNGARESDNFEREDPPGEYVPLRATAGSPLKGVDIVFNRRRPGPIPLDTLLGFDTDKPSGSLEFILPFTFELGGRKFDSVVLNSTNGSLTFGGRGATFINNGRQVDFLAGAPRISALFTELDLLSGGGVSLDQTSDTITIRYVDAPTKLQDLSTGGPNTFSITLHGKKGGHGNRATLSYQHIDAMNGVAGYSCGGGITSWSETQSDLSSMSGQVIRGEGKPAIFEEFSHGIDLDHRTLTFEMPDSFADNFEPNNSLQKARKVQLPFNTAQEFADISPGDADFYRFRAKAGEILVAETTRNEFVDTIISLFGPDGNLVAENDDIIPSWPFSRVIVTVPSDGEYSVRLTSSSKFGPFTASGRYVLNINAYKGAILPLNGDDSTFELPLNFVFPFQGKSWRSVHVNSNGNLSFGAPEIIGTLEDILLPAFLAGPPRIAPFFTDLDPSGSYNGGVTGLVIAEEKADALTVRWVSVPMISDAETNTFSATITSDGDIKMDYDANVAPDVEARGIIIGVTNGNSTVDPGPTDLSRARELHTRGTTYEQFANYFLVRGQTFVIASDIPSFDLPFSRLKFERQ